MTTGKTMADKTLHRKLKIDQQRFDFSEYV